MVQLHHVQGQHDDGVVRQVEQLQRELKSLQTEHEEAVQQAQHRETVAAADKRDINRLLELERGRDEAARQA